MNRVYFFKNETGLTSPAKLNQHEQNQHAGCIRPLRNNFVRMQTIAFYLFLLMISIPCMAQDKSVDNIFSKFNGKKGVTTVNITKDMMELLAQVDSVDFKAKNVMAQIAGIKILVLEEAEHEDKVTFQNMVKNIPLNDYKELMVVKEKDQDVKMLMKEKHGRISEFLLLVTGGDEPVLISISGDLDPKELGKLAGCMKMEGMQYLAQLNHPKGNKHK